MSYVSFDEKEHIYTLHSDDGTKRQLPSNTGIINEAGLGFQSEAVPAHIDLAWYGDRGTKIHLACDYYDDGVLDWDSLAPEIEPFLKSYALGKEHLGFKVREKETVVWDEHERFAGKLDRIVDFPQPVNEFGILAQIDIKSGQPHKFHGYQTAGYNIAKAREGAKYRSMARFCLYLDKNGGMPTLEEYTSLRDFLVFEAALLLMQEKNVA